MPLIVVSNGYTNALRRVTWTGEQLSATVSTAKPDVVSSGTPTTTPTFIGPIANSIFMQITTTAPGPVTVRVRGGGGSGGNGGSKGGPAKELIDVTSPSLAAGTPIVFYAGAAGYYAGAAGSDGSGGGGGGFSFVMYNDPAGLVTWNSKRWTMLALSNGGGGGNDVAYQHSSTVGPSYPTVQSTPAQVSTWFNNNSNFAAFTYSRNSSTGYGGYPGGIATDDSTGQGGGPGYNFAASYTDGGLVNGLPGIVEIYGNI